MHVSDTRRVLAGSLLAILAVAPAGAAPRQRSPFAPFGRAHATAHGPLVRPPQWMSPDVASAATTTGLVFIADLGYSTTGAVEIFAQGNLTTPIGQITNGVLGPTSIAVDGDGVLYVANSGTIPATVTSYKPVHHLYGSVDKTYSIPENQSGTVVPNIAVAPDGTLYVADDDTKFYEFMPGQVTPSLVGQVTNSPGPGGTWGISVDQSKNVYIGFELSGGGTACDSTYSPGYGFTNDPVYRFAPGSTTGTDMGLQNQIGMGQIAFTPGANPAMLVAQCEWPGYPSLVNVFSSAGGAPTRAIASPNFLGVDALTFNKAGTRLYVGNLVGNNVEELTYPGGKVVGLADGYVASHQYGTGVAVYPAAR